MSLHTWHCQDPCKPSSCTTFMLNSHWGNADTSKKKKNLEPMHAGSLWQCPALYDPMDCGLPGFSVREGVVLQARYWSVLANTGCRILLEHYISCCPSRQLPGVPAAARTPVTQAAAHLHTWPSQGQTQVLQGSLKRKPQWTTHMQRWK